jgi:hypothetical protein
MTFFSLVGNSYFLCDKLGNVFFFFCIRPEMPCTEKNGFHRYSTHYFEFGKTHFKFGYFQFSIFIYKLKSGSKLFCFRYYREIILFIKNKTVCEGVRVNLRKCC